MTAFQLKSVSNAVWSGYPVATVEFKVSLPSEFVIDHANAMLHLLSKSHQRDFKSSRDKSAIVENGKQICMIMDAFEYDETNPPALTFRNQTIASPEPIVNNTTAGTELLTLYLNTKIKDDEFLIKTKMHLKDLSVQITAFSLQLDIEGHHPTLQNHYGGLVHSLSDSFQARSNVINITNFKLCIHNITASKGDHELQDKSKMMAFYSKHGGENTSINVMIHIKNRDGSIIEDYPFKLPIKTDLVYEDGTAVCLPSKGQVIQKVYKMMRPEPTLGKGADSCHFAFRIESVSKNHMDHDGFRLKVMCDDPHIADGLMEEIIVVKSRPAGINKRKNDQLFIGGRSTILQKAIGGIPVIVSNAARDIAPIGTSKTFPKKHNCAEPQPPIISSAAPPIVSLEIPKKEQFEVDDAVQPSSILFSPSNVSKFFTGVGDRCLACSEKLSPDEGLLPVNHKPGCELYSSLSPILTGCMMGEDPSCERQQWMHSMLL